MINQDPELLVKRVSFKRNIYLHSDPPPFASGVNSTELGHAFHPEYPSGFFVFFIFAKRMEQRGTPGFLKGFCWAIGGHEQFQHYI